MIVKFKSLTKVSIRLILTLALIVTASIGLTVIFFDSSPQSYSTRNISCGNGPCNVILIVADALSAKHLGVYGYDRQTSPFIDKFFGEGVIFRDASSTAPWTNPSFGSIFTSRYPSEIYLERFVDYLSPSIPTFVTMLRQSGVSVGAFNKDLSPEIDELNWWGIYSSFENEEFSVLTDPLMFDVAGQWIKDHHSNENFSSPPFFALVHTLLTHDPYDPPTSYRSLFDGPANYPGAVTSGDLVEAGNKVGGPTEEGLARFRRQYDQDIRYLDDKIKAFVNNLPDDLLNRSIIILTADHGEGFGQHGRVGHANSLYQELLHVPLLMRIPEGSVINVAEPVSLIDLPATILDIFGLPKHPTFRGNSLLPLLEGKEREESVIKAELATPIWPENVKDFFDIKPKIRTEPPGDRKVTSFRSGNWKVISNYGSSFELYNLSEDPEEKNNLISNLVGLRSQDRAAVEKLLQLARENYQK